MSFIITLWAQWRIQRGAGGRPLLCGPIVLIIVKLSDYVSSDAKKNKKTCSIKYATVFYVQTDNGVFLRWGRPTNSNTTVFEY